MNTRIIASFILFSREKNNFEMESNEDMELSVEQAIERIKDELHKAYDPDGKEIKYSDTDDDGKKKNNTQYDIFNTIMFKEIIIEYRKKMIKYSWRQATIKNSRTRMVECNNYGCFVMTKTIM